MSRSLLSRRRVRGPFVPAAQAGPYRLPPAVLDRLTRELALFRNRDAALALAVFLGRYWSAPGRLERSFPIDRRALAGHAALAGMTEARVRGALATLERVGFLTRPALIGRTHQRTPEGLHRKPLLWRFAPDFLAMFRAVLGPRRAAQGGNPVPRRPLGALPRECPSVRSAAACTNSPEQIPAKRFILTGDHLASGAVARGTRGSTPSPAAPCPMLGAALDRLTAARRRATA